MEGKDLDREIDFIARHYKAGLFNAQTALRKIKPAIHKFRSWQRIAVASCIVVVLSATAALLIRNTYYSKTPTEIENEIENTQSPVVPLETVSKVIDFEDTPLPVVIDQINIVYDVEIGNIPTNAESYRLSLHYEGNVIDLIESINEILGINLQIEK